MRRLLATGLEMVAVMWVAVLALALGLGLPAWLAGWAFGWWAP